MERRAQDGPLAARERYEIRELPSGRVLATATTLGGARLAVRTLGDECGPLELSIYDRAKRRTLTRAAARASEGGRARRSAR